MRGSVLGDGPNYFLGRREGGSGRFGSTYDPLPVFGAKISWNGAPSWVFGSRWAFSRCCQFLSEFSFGHKDLWGEGKFYFSAEFM